jgi:hypothetical protein
VLKVATRVVHANVLHDRPRRQIGENRERDDFGQPKPPKADRQGSLGCFGGVAVPPVAPTVRVAGKYRITSGSRFIAANGAMCRSCQATSRRR